MVKHLPTMRGTQVRSLGWEDPLEKEIATQASTLAWKIPWTGEHGGTQPMESQELGTTYLLNNNNILSRSRVFRFSIFFIFHDSVLESFMILRIYPGCPIC